MHKAQLSQQLKTTQVDPKIIPKLGKKKKLLKTKNPYKVKRVVYIDPDELPRRKLDGYMLLKSKGDKQQSEPLYPHEIVYSNLSNKQINDVAMEDTKYFINLSELDLSENEVQMEYLIYLINLHTLKLSANRIVSLNLNENEQNFSNLQVLDLSYNSIDVQSIPLLQNFPKLTKLSLEANDLSQLPDDMSNFKQLTDLNISCNLFQSDQKAADLWKTLASIPKLRNLDISRNQLRGIHTEKLVAGNFNYIQQIDFSYNIAEDQHNLICSRNFRNLKTLIITGNPFAMAKQDQGLTMEVYTRTGAQVINEDVEKSYLKKKRQQNKISIVYSDFYQVESENILNQRNYFMGVEVPDEQKEPQADEDHKPMFMTENPQQNELNKARIHSENEQQQYKKSINQRIKESEGSGNLFNDKKLAEDKSFQQQTYNYEEFLEKVNQELGDQKEYEQNLDLQTAYKALSKQLRQQEAQQEYQDDPHYMKSTQAIQRYKLTQNQLEQFNITQNQSQISQEKIQKSVSQSNKNNQEQSCIIDKDVLKYDE